jgi:outer membrane protein assembly factor BamB
MPRRIRPARTRQSQYTIASRTSTIGNARRAGVVNGYGRTFATRVGFGKKATAGGLILGGELTGDLVAFDADNGAVKYRFNTGGPIGAGIVTYEVAGHQYIAVASGRPSRFWVQEHSGNPLIMVFALER